MALMDSRTWAVYPIGFLLLQGQTHLHQGGQKLHTKMAIPTTSGSICVSFPLKHSYRPLTLCQYSWHESGLVWWQILSLRPLLLKRPFVLLLPPSFLRCLITRVDPQNHHSHCGEETCGHQKVPEYPVSWDALHHVCFISAPSLAWLACVMWAGHCP